MELQALRVARSGHSSSLQEVAKVETSFEPEQPGASKVGPLSAQLRKVPRSSSSFWIRKIRRDLGRSNWCIGPIGMKFGEGIKDESITWTEFVLVGRGIFYINTLYGCKMHMRQGF